MNWRDEGHDPGEIPGVIQVTFGFAGDRDLAPVVAIGVKVDDGPGRIRNTVAWDDPAERQAFIDRVLQVVDEYEPEYLAIGVEVNRFWELLPDDFESFVGAYADAYDAVKEAAPETLVFTVFQLEMLKGAAYLMGGREALGPQWEVVDRFAGRLDLIGFTTYPYFDYETPAAIPDDYYAELAARYPGIPIALTEIGWPSRPLSVAPDSGFGGTNEEQTAFVRRLGELTEGIPLALALWPFPHDIGPSAGPPPFESTSLRETPARRSRRSPPGRRLWPRAEQDGEQRAHRLYSAAIAVADYSDSRGDSTWSIDTSGDRAWKCPWPAWAATTSACASTTKPPSRW